MNNKKIEALKRILKQAKKSIKFSPDNYEDMKIVEDYIEELEKEEKTA